MTFVRKQRRQILSAQDIDTCRVVADIMYQMIKILNTIEETLHQMYLDKLEKHPDYVSRHSHTFADYKRTYTFIELQISMILKAIPSFTWQVPKQRLEDIELELLRLHYMVSIPKQTLSFQ